MSKILIRFTGLEVFLIFGFIMAQIWILPRHWILVVFGLGFIFLSWRLHKDTLKTVGLLPEDFSQAKAIFCWIVFSLILLIGAAFLINPEFWKQPDFWKKISGQFRNYLGWALFQQLLLQGYFTNRLQMIFKKPFPTAVSAGILFAIVHLPNPVLMIGTFVFGTACAYFFVKSRNLYILALAHAILGTAVKYLVADVLVDHPMRIGPNFWK